MTRIGNQYKNATQCRERDATCPRSLSIATRGSPQPAHLIIDGRPRRSGGQVFVEVVHARGVVLDHRLETASAAPVPRERFLARPIQVITVTPTGFSVRA